MKHKHYDMIVAKAANMDLVLFNKSEDQDDWNVSHETCLPVFSKCDYFLCLPQHKEVCLHWLNGGEVQYMDKGSFVGVTPYSCLIEKIGKAWADETIWMQYGDEIRIKPKKEKRWIAYSTDQKRLGCLTFDSEMEARNHYIHEVDEPQFIEIEVEI